MTTYAAPLAEAAPYPVDVHVPAALEARDRVTVGFRFILAIPHLLLVGAPVAAAFTWPWGRPEALGQAGAGGGALGAAVAVAVMVAWVAILVTGRYPTGLRDLAAYYLRWRVRAVAYMALLRDEYPPFGEGPYPASVDLPAVEGSRDRLTVGFRIVLALPHLLAVWALGVAWFFVTAVAWFAILFTGRHPEGLYRFGVGVLRWSTRVEAYVLLLRDEYPPFSLD